MNNRVPRLLAATLHPSFFASAALSLLLGTAFIVQHACAIEGILGQSGLECIGQISPRHSEQIDGSRWGVCCHWIADKHELSVEQQLEQLSWLGAKWAFLCPDWDRIETDKGQYDFNTPEHRFDEVVAGLVSWKISPVIQIYGGNRLYADARLSWNGSARLHRRLRLGLSKCPWLSVLAVGEKTTMIFNRYLIGLLTCCSLRNDIRHGALDLQSKNREQVGNSSHKWGWL